MIKISPNSLQGQETHVEDITAIWDKCHPHLRPLDVSLPIRGGGDSIKIVAHIRVGGSSWFDLAQITYDRKSGRFLLTEEDRHAALGNRPDLFKVPIDAVNARLWSKTPTMINIEPTTRCNFNCWYCVGRDMKQEDIRVENFERMLDNFPQLKTIALVGEGEPLMHKDFFDMAQMAKDRNIKVMIISNGSAFSQSVVKKLCETEVAYVSISIDSFNPETFASSRIDGDLEKILSGIRRLRDYRDANGFKFPKIALKGTLFSHTIDQLPAIVDMAKASGVEIFESFQALNPMKNYVRIYPKAHISQLLSTDTVAQAIERDSVYGREKLQPMSEFLAENNIDFFSSVVNNPLRKNCDETWLYSLLSGDVTPCCQIKTPISPKWNIYEHGVDEILSDFEYENVRFNLWNGIFPTYCDGCGKTRG
jgi:MoaA/NifB/PqqE/SkfB family radical SAM enzyme